MLGFKSSSIINFVKNFYMCLLFSLFMDAYLSKSLSDNKVKCLACAHNCVIGEGKKGICSIRENVGGKLILNAYGSAVSMGVDPVEKKPLYHFLPGSLTFSFGTLGCNFKCGFCQNFDISFPKNFVFKKNLSPEEAVFLAKNNGCKSISYTYTEPAIFAEYVIDTARLAKKAGLKNVLVTNGFLSQESLDKFSEVIDAVNIDLKSFNEDFYKKHCRARLDPVLNAIKFFHKKNIWVEVTTLLIPDMNDSVDELKKIASFIASVDNEIPWHISRFFPMHEFSDKSITPIETLHMAKTIGIDEGLKFIYLGNVPLEIVTSCPSCQKDLIIRNNFVKLNLENNKCVCGYELRGVF